ncbi:DUF4236 domain-containing protein [Acinetobacter sp. SwsAc5]|uniref:DUF4236 domain-containing protein n=1 Tax=Acinetobacter sp. SwsAc5 TaxID=2749438 RepID=UPI0015C06A3A|nr:DUF4236 domain-containing protein [Acinetobacter sp. SwsAc5]NWK51971.1 DUF4236 domain-containing protein [Acinetobacter sp. SwsAc5]
MGWNFRKSIKIAPNVRLNIGKKGISGVSVGGKGLRFGIGRKGTRTSVSIPKTGLSYSTFRSYKKNRPANQQTGSDNTNFSPDQPKSNTVVTWIIIFILIFLFFSIFG